MRAGTLQLHDGKVARRSGACVRGPLVAESCVTGPEVSTFPRVQRCSDLAVRLLSKAKGLFSHPPFISPEHISLRPTSSTDAKDFAQIFANLWPADRNGGGQI